MLKSIQKVSALLALAFVLGSCGAKGEADEDDISHHHHHHDGEAHANSQEIVIPPEKARAAGVRSEILKAGDFSEVIQVSGQIDNSQSGESTLVAQSAGIVHLDKSLVEGVALHAGESLLTINAQNLPDSDPYQKARIAYDAARVEFEKGKKLYAGKLITLKEYNELKTAVETLQLQVDALGKSRKNGVQVVCANLNGYLQRCFVSNGDYVEVGQPLAQISQNQQLLLKVDVPEKYYSELPLVRSANIKLPSGEVVCLADYGAKVVGYGQTSADSYYIPLTLSFMNKGKVIPGSFVEVWLLTASRGNVISLPEAAIVEEQGLYFAYVQMDDDCYTKQEVRLGARDGKRVEILSGLKAGERVVTAGAYQVKVAGASSTIPGHTHEH